jgi:tetratricopeptide (TPR) repeat protein
MALGTMQKRQTWWAVLFQKWPRSPFWRLTTLLPGAVVLWIAAAMDKTSVEAIRLTFAFGLLALVLPAWMAIYVPLRDKHKSLLEARNEVLEPLKLDPPDMTASLKWLLPRWSRSSVHGCRETYKKLDAWLESSTPIMIIKGGPLVGKTRIAIEWADSLGPEWETGWLRHDKAAEALKRIAAYGKNTVMVVDGAPPHVAELVRDLSRHKSPPQIRVLLTVRNVNGLRIEDPYAAAEIEEAKSLHLGPRGDISDRERWFEDLCRHYADRLGVPVPPKRPEFIRELGAVPIGVLQAAALVAARTGAVPMLSSGIEELLYEVWKTEVDVWRNAPRVPGSGHDGVGDAQLERLEHAVIALSLLEPGDAQSAVELLGKIPSLNGIGAAMLTDIEAWAASTYPRADRRGPAAIHFSPKIIVVAAFLHAADRNWNFGHAVLGSLAHPQASAVLNKIVGAVTLLPSVAVWVTEIISCNFGRLSAAIEMALAAAPASPILDRELARNVDGMSLDEEQTSSLLVRIPAESLRTTQVALWKIRVKQLRVKVRNDGGKDESDLAEALSTLAWLTEAGGRGAEALAAAEEAVIIYRRLAEENPALHESNLALALNNLAFNFAKAGGHGAEALAAAEEAVSIYRRLEENPALHRPYLARALITLAFEFDEAGGRGAEALAAAEEAVSIYRRLAEEHPAVHEPPFARGLSNLGGQLAKAGGRGAEALSITAEAVTIYRRLAEEAPALHEPDLAWALNNLAIIFGDAGGRGAEALAAAEEAVTIYRRLAEENPALHGPNLAQGLKNLAAHLGEAGGRGAEGRIVSQEAVVIFRRLAAENPALYAPDFAHALNNLAGHLRMAGGRGAEALSTSQEAVTIYRRLTEENPALHEPDLALTLTSLASTLGIAPGRGAEAVDAAQEAVSIYRRLAAASPAMHEPDLALAMNNLAGCLSRAGLNTDAAKSWRELLHLYKRLARQDSRFDAPLARVQRIIAEQAPLP